MKSKKLMEFIDKIPINVGQTVYKVERNNNINNYVTTKSIIKSIDISIDMNSKYSASYDLIDSKKVLWREQIANLGINTFITEKEANQIRDSKNRELEDKKRKEEKEREEKLKNITSNLELILKATNHCLSEECEGCPMDGLYKHDCDRKLLELIKERIVNNN